MYKEYLKIAPSKNGNGVFTNVIIPAKSPIMEVTGDLFTKETAPNNPDIFQVGHNLFIGPSGAADDYVNHSCNPNCFIYVVGNRAFLYSLYQIAADTELTWDYSTSSTDTTDTWKMDCPCNDFNCRKVISGFQYLDAKLQEEYKKKGMVPLFMHDPIFSKAK